MVINFYGEGCFKIQSGETTILTDPFDKKIGLTPPRFKSDIILKTLTPIPITEQSTDDSMGHIIWGPGEYNIKNININGFLLPAESSENFLKSVYLVEMENINLCFLGHSSNSPEPIILEKLEKIDILFIPAGGKPFIEQKTAAKIIKQIQPKIVIPCFFKIPLLKRPAEKIENFLDEFNGSKNKNTKGEEKLTIKKKELDGMEKTEIIILKA
ncbi:MBL fold metallo-hydrolase [Candidatus Wolfebacteria bacterium]|nr:MBL fold metallo-hydrolase [Candidatus Wolfebacteria bacterium]